MPQTAVSMAQVVKEAWTADRLQKQYEDKNLPLGKIEALRGVMIGRQAQTPVWGGRSGAFTTVGAGGGSLNPPLQQPVAQALWTLVYNWFQIALDTSALAQASGQSLQSVVGAKDLEIEEAVISAVDYSNPAAPTVTLPSAIATTAGTHFFYIPNPNSPTASSPELNGLRQIVASGALGGLNSATAGQEFWRGAFRDVTTTTFSLDLPLNLQRYVLQNSNKPGTDVWTSYRQQANFYALLQNQVQFAGDQNLGAGNVSGPKWNGMSVQAFADVLDTDWFQLTLSDLVRVTSGIDKPTWASDIEGSGQSFSWQQGTTRFVDGLVYPMQLGVQRRNTQAAALALK
jgi:hypothetical protein